MMSTSGDLDNVDFSLAGQAFSETENRHVLDFMAARKQRTRPLADIEQGHISSAMCVLANLAVDLGRPLAYDPITRTVPGDPTATALLARPYRAPWRHPDPLNV